MDADIKKRWVEALRSGGYQQGTGRLQLPDSPGARYCCLGVLCELSSLPYNPYNADLPATISEWAGLYKSSPRIPLQAVFDLYDDDDDMLLELVEKTKHVGLSSCDDVALVDLNDSYNLTFNQIADIIENLL